MKASCVAMCLYALAPLAVAEQVNSTDLACQLNPNCGTSKTRSLSGRGVSIEVGQPSAPPSVNLYVNFAYDSSELTQDAKITLTTLGNALTDASLKDYVFEVVGHTDAKGDEEYNLSLSNSRASAVRTFLIAKFGISVEKLRAFGKGEAALLDASQPESGINRRVQVINVGTK